jgi:hypothetical protein
MKELLRGKGTKSHMADVPKLYLCELYLYLTVVFICTTWFKELDMPPRDISGVV